MLERDYSFSKLPGEDYFKGMINNPEYFKKNKGITFEYKKMSPEAYMQIINKAMNYNAMNMVDLDVVEEYARKISGGAKFPIPWLEYYANGKLNQEGRHRILAMDRLGVKWVDVLVINHYVK